MFQSLMRRLQTVAPTRYGREDFAGMMARLRGAPPTDTASAGGQSLPAADGSQHAPAADPHALATFYRDLWNEFAQAGVPLQADEVDEVEHELAPTGLALDYDEAQGGWRIVSTHSTEDYGRFGAILYGQDPAQQRPKQARAVSPGVSVNGKAYRGGQFIPNVPASEVSHRYKDWHQAHQDKAAKHEARGTWQQVHTDLHQRLSPHQRELDPAEAKKAERSLSALRGHHGVHALHRLEELVAQGERGLARTAEGTPGRAAMQARLGAYHHMLASLQKHPGNLPLGMKEETDPATGQKPAWYDTRTVAEHKALTAGGKAGRQAPAARGASQAPPVPAPMAAAAQTTEPAPAAKPAPVTAPPSKAPTPVAPSPAAPAVKAPPSAPPVAKPAATTPSAPPPAAKESAPDALKRLGVQSAQSSALALTPEQTQVQEAIRAGKQATTSKRNPPPVVAPPPVSETQPVPSSGPHVVTGPPHLFSQHRAALKSAGGKDVSAGTQGAFEFPDAASAQRFQKAGFRVTAKEAAAAPRPTPAPAKVPPRPAESGADMMNRLREQQAAKLRKKPTLEPATKALEDKPAQGGAPERWGNMKARLEAHNQAAQARKQTPATEPTPQAPPAPAPMSAAAQRTREPAAAPGFAKIMDPLAKAREGLTPAPTAPSHPLAAAYHDLTRQHIGGSATPERVATAGQHVTRFLADAAALPRTELDALLPQVGIAGRQPSKKAALDQLAMVLHNQHDSWARYGPGGQG